MQVVRKIIYILNVKAGISNKLRYSGKQIWTILYLDNTKLLFGPKRDSNSKLMFYYVVKKSASELTEFHK